MNLPTIRVEDMYKWFPKPCYPSLMAYKWAGGDVSFDALDVLQHADLKADDKLWVVVRERMIPIELLREIACVCAEHVLLVFEEEHPDDTRPRDAIEIRRKWLRDRATDEGLEVVRRKADRAGWDAYRKARIAGRSDRYAAYAAWAAKWATTDDCRCVVLDACQARGGREEASWQVEQLIWLLAGFQTMSGLVIEPRQP